MEDRLRDRGIADPAAWLARPGRDLDASLAEAVTLSVDDVVLSGLLERLSATPVATELVTGASVYRVPVDDTALVFQVGQPAERPPDPDAPGPHRPGPAGHPGSHRTRRRRPDLAGGRRADRGGVRPLPGRPGRGAAAAGRGAGRPGRRGGRGPGRRAADPGTARGPGPGCISCTGGRPGPSPRSTPTPPARPTGGRRRSGAGGSTPSRKAAEQDIEQLLEARYHHHAAGQTRPGAGSPRRSREPAADVGTVRAGGRTVPGNPHLAHPRLARGRRDRGYARHPGPAAGGLRRRRALLPPGPGDLRAHR